MAPAFDIDSSRNPKIVPAPISAAPYPMAFLKPLPPAPPFCASCTFASESLCCCAVLANRLTRACSVLREASLLSAAEISSPIDSARSPSSILRDVLVCGLRSSLSICLCSSFSRRTAEVALSISLRQPVNSSRTRRVTVATSSICRRSSIPPRVLAARASCPMRPISSRMRRMVSAWLLSTMVVSCRLMSDRSAPRASTSLLASLSCLVSTFIPMPIPAMLYSP